MIVQSLLHWVIWALIRDVGSKILIVCFSICRKAKKLAKYSSSLFSGFRVGWIYCWCLLKKISDKWVILSDQPAIGLAREELMLEIYKGQIFLHEIFPINWWSGKGDWLCFPLVTAKCALLSSGRCKTCIP